MRIDYNCPTILKVCSFQQGDKLDKLSSRARVDGHMQMFGSKTYFHLRLVVVAWMLLWPAAADAQVIKDFKSKLTIAANGNVDVVEDLTISLPATSQRNQFYRILPIWYEPWEKLHVVDVNVTRVVMDDNVDVPFQSWLSGRDFYLKVGDTTTPLKGVHRFHIEYQIMKGVHFNNGNPQLYLSVTGEQSPIPIQNASVTIIPPNGVDMSRVTASGLVGVKGNWKKQKAMVGRDTVLVSAQKLEPAQGLSVVVDLPRGSVVPHSVLYDVVLYMQKFYQSFVLPVATMILLSSWWWLYGRDPGAGKNVSAGWFPPEGMTPAEAGTLIDESCDLHDLVSTLIDLAARGFIKIRVLPYTGFLYLDNKDYEFTLLRSTGDPELKPHEQLFLVALFGGLSGTTYLSAVKGNFSEYIPDLKKRVYSNLVTEGLFARDPEVDRKNFLSAGAAIITVGTCLMVVSAYHVSGQAAAIGAVLSGLVVLLAANAMPRRTSKGVAELAQLRRFQKMLASGDKDELGKVATESPQAFDKFLAYAIVLGLADRWADAFDETVRDYPDWYEVDDTLLSGEFSSKKFVHQLHDGLNVINRALTDPPQVTTTVNSSTIDRSSLHYYHRDSHLL